MDIDVARRTIRQSFLVAREPQDLLPFLKERCEPDGYKQYAFDIAAAPDAVSVALLNKAIKAYPELEGEIDRRIAERGEYL
jgi:hypothetical protein